MMLDCQLNNKHISNIMNTELVDTYLAIENNYFAFCLYILAAIIPKYSKKFKKMGFQEMMIFQQNRPIKNWSEEDLSTVIAQAYVYQSYFMIIKYGVNLVYIISLTNLYLSLFWLYGQNNIILSKHYSMKIDCKSKQEHLKRFVDHLKSNPNIEPFWETEDLQRNGVYDFYYINQNVISFADVQRKIKLSLYENLQDYLRDLRKVIISISDFAFQTDPIQEICDQFLELVNKFESSFNKQYENGANEIKSRSKLEIPRAPKIPPSSIQQKSIQNGPKRNLLQKQEEKNKNMIESLQMMFLLRQKSQNKGFLRYLLENSDIAKESEGQFIIDIDISSKFWQDYKQEDS